MTKPILWTIVIVTIGFWIARAFQQTPPEITLVIGQDLDRRYPAQEFRNVVLIHNAKEFHCDQLVLVPAIGGGAFLVVDDRHPFDDPDSIDRAVDLIGGSQVDKDVFHAWLAEQKSRPELSNTLRTINHDGYQLALLISSGMTYYSITIEVSDF